jgi:Pyruvate/2-oxoacid:ferredoxin oxidoreductase gamma subunit
MERSRPAADQVGTVGGAESTNQMERELLLTGIGGQGVQLAAQVLARAAIAEGRTAQMFGSYGGMMRGGNTEATLVVADGAIGAPPTVAEAWSAIFMHHDFSEPTRAKLRPGSLVVVNTTVFEGPAFDPAAYLVVEIPATDLAVDLGNIMTASMIILGAYVAATGMVGLASLETAVTESLPAYRSQHVARNIAAIGAGFEFGPRDVAPAWTEVAA